MTAAKWRRIITESCEKVGTNEPQFQPIVKTLASILEKRDAAEKQFIDEGSKFIIEKVNTRSGEANPSKNPLIILIMDLNTQALAYWRDLGLTPAGLKKLNADGLSAKATAGFEQLLAKIGQ